ncbi:SDR family oxidoreductase [Streptomyces hilarionis]|uniref:SDR family oxidoreductase n=1 Tax=Streptomyces hilarionis TaxID=2839954 RepID=UPI00211A1D09|nr:SDR family oxidoreductase [Streptomyces hilarionis]MCQ9129951.1 SDR family oxidoreductase [Streptomyces hilarionis]
MPESPLKERAVVITGAARGLGAAQARELARRGARLALVGHEGPALRRLAASLPGPALALEADVTDAEALGRAAAAVRERLGPPSVVVANAGVAEGGPFAEADMVSWRRVIDVNVVGSALTARTFLPDLMETAGYYLQIASLASMGAAPLMSAYCASKAAVEAFAHSLRAEVAQHGVAVGVAYLNWTDTDMIRDADRHAVLRELRAHMPAPARRVYPPEFVARRLATAVERRRTVVYVPAWLRLVQGARAALPPLVLRVSRYELPRLEAAEPFRPTGLLGAGGRADGAAGRPGEGRGGW